MKTKVAYCTKKGEPEWTEQVLTDHEASIPEATKWAEANGYAVRVAEIDLGCPPDWSQTLNLK